MQPTQRLAMQATRALRSAHPDPKNGVYVFSDPMSLMALGVSGI